MDSLVLAINVVVPLFLLMALGYILNITKLLDDGTLATLNKLVFKIFLPALLFYNVYRTNIKTAINGRLMAFSVVAVLITAVAMFIIIPLLEKDNKKRGVIIQGIFRSNFVLFGVPVASAILGEDNIGGTSVLIAVVVPMFNIMAVITLEFFRGGTIGGKKILSMIKGVFTNPLIIASLVGLIFLWLDIKLPKALEVTVSDISKLATPLSLMVLGGTFRFRRISGNIKQLAIMVIGKLIVYPVIVIYAALKMGFTGAAIVSLISMTASPAAVSSFTMAEEMEADGELAGQGVVMTTALSIITVFAFVFVLNEMGVLV